MGIENCVTPVKVWLDRESNAGADPEEGGGQYDIADTRVQFDIEDFVVFKSELMTNKKASDIVEIFAYMPLDIQEG